MSPIFSSNNKRRPGFVLTLITTVSLCVQACGPAQSVDGYISRLEGKDLQVRKSALEEIGKWYSHEGCEEDCPSEREFYDLNTALINLLSDPDPEIRLQVVRYLSASTDERILKAFPKLFHDEDSRVRAIAAEAFSLIAFNKKSHIEIVRGLERLLKDPSKEVRQGGALGLRTNGDHKSLTVLREAYAQEHDSSVKEIMGEAINVLHEHWGKGNRSSNLLLIACNH